MKKRIARMATMVGLALGSLVLPMAASPASAATSYGPYQSQGTCNYWAGQMRSAGHNAGNCFYWTDPRTCPGGSCHFYHGWYFLVY